MCGHLQHKNVDDNNNKNNNNAIPTIYKTATNTKTNFYIHTNISYIHITPTGKHTHFHLHTYSSSIHSITYLYTIAWY